MSDTSEPDAPQNVPASEQDALFEDTQRTFSNTIVQGQEYARIMSRHLSVSATELEPIVQKLEEARSLFEAAFQPKKG